MRLKTFTFKINKVAIILAIFSACFGITLLICHLIFKSNAIIEIGIYHLYPTIIIHLIVLSLVIINGIKNTKDYKEHLLTAGLILLNIPLAFTCFFIVIDTL